MPVSLIFTPVCTLRTSSILVIQSISGCLSHYKKTQIQTDQSNASYTKTSLSTANLIVQFASLFFCDGTSNLKLTVSSNHLVMLSDQQCNMLKLKVTQIWAHMYIILYNNADCHLLTMLLYTYAGGRMGSVSQSAVRPSLLATLTLATRSALTWTTTAVIRASTATGGVEDQKYSILKPILKL